MRVDLKGFERNDCCLGANILRDISGNVKLGDFGTSRRLISITNQNQPNSGTIGKNHLRVVR